MKSKQVIVMRKDLNMRKGKMVAQGAHASLKALLDSPDFAQLVCIGIRDSGTEALESWLKGSLTKICVSVDSEDQLLSVYYTAKDKGLICSLIQDSGATEFHGVPTYTCCAIGPNCENEIDEITGELKLL